jgi:hypothetical protein
MKDVHTYSREVRGHRAQFALQLGVKIVMSYNQEFSHFLSLSYLLLNF